MATTSVRELKYVKKAREEGSIKKYYYEINAYTFLVFI